MAKTKDKKSDDEVKKTPVLLRFEKEFHKRLKAQADAEMRPVTNLILRILTEYLDSHSGKGK